MRFKKILAVSIIFILLCPAVVHADDPYSNYTYDFWGTPVPAPAAYVPDKIIDGASLGIGSFNKPSDLFVGPGNKIYIADTGNNRIVVMNDDWKLVRIISSFNNEGSEDSFKNPTGLFVTQDENLYVADTDNSRIVHFDANGNFVREIGRPVSDIIPDDFKYYPTALVVDKAQRIYVVALGCNQGLIELDSEAILWLYGRQQGPFTWSIMSWEDDSD